MDQGKTNSEAGAAQVIQEYVVKIPKDRNKRFNVMRFNRSLNVDVTKWKQVKMERENNLKEFRLEEDGPKYGAGSEFGREQKEEARRKKHGIVVRQYNPDDQPWILKLLGKGNKKFKGIREGGVTENASYYVFTQAPDGTFEAFPVAEWYNFTPIQCFKALSAEEAEEEFGRRDKVLNYFTIMVKKRLQADTNEEEDEEDKKQKGKKKKKKKGEKEFKITDMDEMGNTLDSEDSDGEGPDDDDEPSKKGKKKKKKTEKDKDNSDEEAVEESDEGDFDDKEVDYITSSSSSSEEEIGEEEKTNRDLKGVEDEEALRKLMDDEEEEEEEQANGEQKEQEPEAEVKEKEPEKKPKPKKPKSDSSGESSSESSDSDLDDQKFNSAIFVQQNVQKGKKKTGSDSGSATNSRANTPTKLLGDKEGHKGQKRKLPDMPAPGVKKVKTESSNVGNSSGTLDCISEEMVRRYLQRKPMTASELLHKFKSKKTNMTSEQLVTGIAEVLKKMSLQKTNIKGKMYLSLKNT